METHIEQPKWLDLYLRDIRKLQMLIDQLGDDQIDQRVRLLSKMLVLIGKVSAEMTTNYKKIYATRKRVYTDAYLAASKHRTQMAEKAVEDLRMEEAEAEGNMRRWQNAFISTREEIHALKFEGRISIEDGSSQIV